MADDITPTAPTDADIPDVSLVDTPIAPKADAPSETAEQGTDDAAAASDKPEDDKATSDANGNEAASQDDKQPDQPTQTPEEAKAEQNRVAREAFLERQRRRQEIEQQLDQAYGPQSQEDLVDAGMSVEDARYEALRQEIAYKEQRTQIAELNAGMQAEAVNVTNDFAVFNPNSKEYDETFAQEVQQAYLSAARVQLDERGIVTNAEVPLYDFYKRMAGIYTRGASKGAQDGQAEMAAMLSRTEDTVGGSSSTSGGSESLEDMERRLGDVVIT